MPLKQFKVKQQKMKPKDGEKYTKAVKLRKRKGKIHDLIFKLNVIKYFKINYFDQIHLVLCTVLKALYITFIYIYI